MFRFCLFFLIIAGCPALVLAQAPVVLTDTQETYRLGHLLEYLEDPTGRLTIDDVTSQQISSRFARNKTDVPSFGFTRSIYWARIQLRNATSLNKDWRLMLEFPNMQEITCYRPGAAENSFDVIRTGTNYPFASRDIPYHRFVFNIPVLPETDTIVYLRFRNDWAMTFPLSLRSPDGFMRYIQWDFMNLGLVYGALILLIIYNLFLWLALQERNYGYYVGVLAFMLLGHITYEGLPAHYWWPDAPHLTAMGLLVFFPMISILGMMFAISFLNTRNRSPIGHCVIVGFIGIWGLMLILMPFVDPGTLPRVVMPLRLANSLVFTGINYLIWRRGYGPARYFFLAWLMTAMTFIPFAMVRLGIMPSFTIAEQGIRFGMILTGLFFSFALADRIQTLQREKDAAQGRFLAASRNMETMIRKQNILLEKNVRERTRELQKEIHEHRETEVQLKQAKESAEAADQAKGRFLSMMSHELRTPLNAILGYAQLLQKKTNKESLEFKGLKTIEHSGNHLLLLIEDLLDLAKIETQKIELTPAPFSLPEQLKILADMIRLRAREKGLTFSWKLSPDIPTMVLGDVRQLRQILLNLLGNAVKFTKQGSVKLEVAKMNENELRFSIRDTGPGIAEDQIDHIFTPFVQFKESGQSSEGVGLGLTISRSLLRAMGAELYVESAFGKGSTFWFALNLPAVESERISFPEACYKIAGIRGTPPRVLIVDDHEYNRQMVRHFLESLGFLISEAEDGQKALDFAEKEIPDLVLMDLMMPVLDGYETARRMHRSPALSRLKIIIMTADAAVNPGELMTDIGCDAVITKPIQNDELLELLGRHLNLEWIHENLEVTTSAGTPIVIPASADLDKIQNLAAMGAYTEILEELTRLRQQDPDAVPFADHLLGLLNRFQFDAILHYLDSP